MLEPSTNNISSSSGRSSLNHKCLPIRVSELEMMSSDEEDCTDKEQGSDNEDSNDSQCLIENDETGTMADSSKPFSFVPEVTTQYLANGCHLISQDLEKPVEHESVQIGKPNGIGINSKNHSPKHGQESIFDQCHKPLSNVPESSANGYKMFNTSSQHTPMSSLVSSSYVPYRNRLQTPLNKASYQEARTPSQLLSEWSHHSLLKPLQEKKNFSVTPQIHTLAGTQRNNYQRCEIEIKEGTRRPLILSQQNLDKVQSKNSYPVGYNNSLKIVSNTSDKGKVVVNNFLQTSTHSIEKKKGRNIGEDAKENNYPSKSIIQNEQHPISFKCSQLSSVLESDVESRYIEHKESLKSIVPSHLGSGVFPTKDSVIENNDINKISTVNKMEFVIDKYKEHDRPSTSRESKSKSEGSRHDIDKISNVQSSVALNKMMTTPVAQKLVIKDKEYISLSILGHGMSGRVLKAYEVETSELRAIKCVNLGALDTESAKGCLNEIELLGRLQASCIVKMFDFEVKYPEAWVVLELGDTDLSKFLKTISTEKKLPLTMIIYYWTEMLTAVKYIHDEGVIHSDLKPANFLLVKGRLKLIDFGISSNLNADMTSVEKQSTAGTLNYISPEALLDVSDPSKRNTKYKINFKSDVWSLGCILYSMVYGYTPFSQCRSQWAKMNAITNPNYKISFPFQVSQDGNEEMPPSILRDVMAKCLQHDYRNRPTVDELLKVPYIPNQPKGPDYNLPRIPQSILLKVREALNDDEWRSLLQILESRR